MNFQQLRIIRETVRQNFNLTQASNVLFTSQSGVSKHILDLEDELGVQIFNRKGKRLLSLTDAGQALLTTIERMLLDADNIKHIADDFTRVDEGELIIATTHTQARYVLPHVVAAFKKSFPKVHLVLQQASPIEVAEMLLRGEADIGIATESLAQVEGLASIPYYHWHHSIITPKDHPLTKRSTVSLEDLTHYPLITYHGGFTGRSKIDDTFTKANLTPDIVMSALDADVIKTYVQLGMGIGIVASIAFDAAREPELTQLSCDLFGENTTQIAIRKHHLLRGFGYRFIELCGDRLDVARLRNEATAAN